MDQTWSCPGDRELSLRAKLGTGWSYHTNKSNRKVEILTVEEQDHILDVVRRNEALEEIEKRRIGLMMEKLENMKKLVNGNGTNQCVLCGHEFRLLGASAYRCVDCSLAICSKCGVDTIGRNNRTVWFCKICSEQREVWKRSGAWFFKTLPNYIRHSNGSNHPINPLQASRSSSVSQTSSPAPPEISMTWTRVGRRRSSSSEGVSSEDEFSIARQQPGNNVTSGSPPIVTIRSSDSP